MRVYHKANDRIQGHELLKSPIKIEVSQISKKALEAVESVGGKVDLLYYNA